MSTYGFNSSQYNINNELMDCLSELRFRSQGIIGAAIVSIEGLPIATMVLDAIDDTRFSAMTAAMLSLGERVAIELNKGVLKKILIEGEYGYIVSLQAGSDAVLTVNASSDVKLGLLFLDMQRIAEKVESLLTKM